MRIISPLKCRSWSFAQEKAAKNTALGGSYHRGLSGHFSHPSASRKVPHLLGPSCKQLIQCLRLILALAERKSPGYQASFTGGQTEVTALHLQSCLRQGRRSSGSDWPARCRDCHPAPGGHSIPAGSHIPEPSPPEPGLSATFTTFFSALGGARMVKTSGLFLIKEK